MRALFHTFVLVIVLLLPRGGAFAASPQEAIETLHATLLEVMKMAPSAGTQARYDVLKPKLDSIYDFRRMIEVAAGSYWANADSETQDKLAAAFARMSVMTYADRFRTYNGESFRVLGERPGPRDTVLVETEIDRGPQARLAAGESQTVPITYVMTQNDGHWQITDVLLDQSISELALRRSEYSKILRDGGPAQLIDVLNKKSDQLAASK